MNPINDNNVPKIGRKALTNAMNIYMWKRHESGSKVVSKIFIDSLPLQTKLSSSLNCVTVIFRSAPYMGSEVRIYRILEKYIPR
jgi:hypothetical protein